VLYDISIKYVTETENECSITKEKYHQFQTCVLLLSVGLLYEYNVSITNRYILKSVSIEIISIAMHRFVK
jgi:hypothetical protein